MNILLATNNKDKIKEIKEVFAGQQYNFYTLQDFNIVSDPEETGSTYQENALIKAEAVHKIISKKNKLRPSNLYSNISPVPEVAIATYPPSLAVLADDSGLSVEALDGAPGLYSARYAGQDGEHPTYADNCKKLLNALKGEKNRNAYFETDIVFIYPDGKTINTKGICEGKIATSPRGDNGFGYDPIFLPKAHNYKFTMAELPERGKNAISHRAIALKKLKEILIL